MNFEYTTERLQLKSLNEYYAEEVLDFYLSGRDVFDAVEADKSPAFYTSEYQAKSLYAETQAFLNGSFYRYFWTLKESPDIIIGTCSFSNIMHSPYNCALLGYKLLPFYQKSGFAIEALSCLIKAFFEDNHMHRIEAYVLPNNAESIKLLERLNFYREALCKKMILMNGQYVDHLKYVLINPRD